MRGCLRLAGRPGLPKWFQLTEMTIFALALYELCPYMILLHTPLRGALGHCRIVRAQGDKCGSSSPYETAHSEAAQRLITQRFGQGCTRGNAYTPTSLSAACSSGTLARARSVRDGLWGNGRRGLAQLQRRRAREPHRCERTPPPGQRVSTFADRTSITVGLERGGKWGVVQGSAERGPTHGP